MANYLIAIDASVITRSIKIVFAIVIMSVCQSVTILVFATMVIYSACVTKGS
jgi:hypothetical protein